MKRQTALRKPLSQIMVEKQACDQELKKEMGKKIEVRR